MCYIVPTQLIHLEHTETCFCSCGQVNFPWMCFSLYQFSLYSTWYHKHHVCALIYLCILSIYPPPPPPPHTHTLPGILVDSSSYPYPGLGQEPHGYNGPNQPQYHDGTYMGPLAVKETVQYSTVLLTDCTLPTCITIENLC